jgi:hypothetical protein
MAMNMRFFSGMAFLAVSRINHEETRLPRRTRSRFRHANRGDAALALIRLLARPSPIHGRRDVLEGLPPNNAAANLVMENLERGKDAAGTVSLQIRSMSSR